MGNKTVLIVEDVAFDQALLARVIEKLGFAALCCEDGQQALVLLKQRPDIDLMLLDLGIPNVDGISLMGHCKRHHPSLQVMIVSASDDADDLAQTIHWGAVDFFRKPVDIERLSASVKEILNRKAAG